MERKLATIMATDVVGYSRLVEIDETGTIERLQSLRRELVDPTVARHGGELVKLIGDGSLIAFDSVVAALQCAVDIQRQQAAHNASLPDRHRLELRIALHLGDVIVDGGDLYGDGVNVASRLESVAAPGGIVLSRQVYDHIGSNVPVRFRSIGEVSVKNLSRPIEAFHVDFAADDRSPRVLRFRDFELDTACFELRKAGRRIPVEPQVFDLLAFLATHSDRTVTKEEIFATIWRDRVVSDAALSSQIKAARKAVGDDGTTQHTIATLHGRGFRFVAPIDGGAKLAPPAPGEADRPLSAARKPSIAVLPFLNLANETGEDYIADGIAEDIITALSRNRWLTVVARTSAFAFRDSREALRTLGEKLDADYLVTGSVRRAGSRLRATVQVVEAATEHSVWAERFDRDIVDVFELQEDVAKLVAARVETELGLAEQKKAERKPRKNLGAWELYQLGMAEFYRFTPENNLMCQKLMRRAIELDPEFASAHARLAYAMVLSMVYFDAPTDAARLDEALAAAQRAAELDDQDANVYFTLGRVRLARREYDLAIGALEHALSLNPALAVTYCGLGDSLTYEGRLDEAIERFDMAIRLSPHDPFRWAFYAYRALAHIFRHEFAEAATWARASIQTPHAQYWPWAHLVAAMGHLGPAAGTAQAVSDLLRVKPGFSLAFARQRLFYLSRQEQIDLYIDGLRKAGIE